MSCPDVVYVAVSGETLVAEQQQMPRIRDKHTHTLQSSPRLCIGVVIVN